MFTVSKLKVTTSVTYNKEADATKRIKKTNKTIKFVSTKKTKLSLTMKYDDKAADTVNQQTAKITVKYSPTKVGYKGMKWKAKNSKIVYVSPVGVVTPLKKGSTKIYGYTKDGTNKKVTINVTVNAAPVTATPTPNLEKDPRTATTVEDFESYAEGTTWKNYTAGGYSNSGTMTVVKDPENPKNKVLKVDYTGTDQAYDFAPVFNLTLPNGKKLSEFSAIRLKSRVIANTADCNYKTVGVFFDGYGTIKPSDYFYTANFDGSDPKKATKREYRFGTKVSMATGVDVNYNVPDSVQPGLAIQDKDIIAISPAKKYNNKVFPTYYKDYEEKKDKTAVSPGYSETETNESNKVGFQQNTLELNTDMINAAWISDSDKTPLLDRNKLDMVLGATYIGSQGRSADAWHLTLYLDDIQMLSGTIACTGMSFVNPPSTLNIGSTTTMELLYEPKNTTQKEVTWSSSDTTLATVDSVGKVTANSDGKTGEVTITATNKENPNVKATAKISIEKVQMATTDLDILSTATIVPTSSDENAKLKSEISDVSLSNGQLAIDYEKTNVSVLLDLGREVNINQYRGVEITGNMPGSIALEFYGSTLDMTSTKDKGAAKDWWETCAGKTYPFYNGSSMYRSEAGGMNRTVLLNRYGNPTNDSGKPIATDETIRFTLNKLAENGNGDWSKIRYVIIKSNNNPWLPAALLNGKNGKFRYTVKGLKLTSREVYDFGDNAGSRYTVSTEQANVAATGAAASAYYVDNVSSKNPAATHNSKKDLQDFKYIKLAVKDAADIKVGLLKEGQSIGEYTVAGQSSGGASGEKTVYYRIDNLGDGVDIHNVDSIVVELPKGGSITKLQLTQGEIAYDSTDPKQYEIVDGAEKEVTEAVYGKD